MFCSMANPSGKMMEVSRVGVEEEDEIELSLGLSIGGSFRKPEKSKLIDENHFNFNKEINSVSTNVSQKHHCFSTLSEQDSGSEYANPQAKHENIQRRNKRGEKLRNGLHGGTDGGYPVTNEFSDDKLLSEAKWLQNPVRERKVRENGALVAERACKRGKKEDCAEMKDLNLTLSRNGSFDQTHISNPPMLSSSPSAPAQYSYPPLSNGFVYPYAMPNWSTLPLCNVAGKKNDNDVFPPLTFPNFRPDQGNQNSGHNLWTSRDSSCFDYEVNSSKDGRNGNMVSNWSPLRNLSVVLDHPSKSLRGDSSSDTKNHLPTPNLSTVHLVIG
ncbi:uncharacterized protein LOC132268372 [Cornus florida]|uniref:uncharacterized protein LOC132268372 n=1 Tax=Cornus florida TaxID=4283 RepID=UPI0028A0B654|nr:uncharacterized protein LOC132268372 [Cornus florida]